MRYRQFKDDCRAAGLRLGDSVSVKFYLPMPKSWSKKKRAEMDGKPHQQKPDVDNICKALLDACLVEDSHVYAITAVKYWAENGAVELWQD